MNVQERASAVALSGDIDLASTNALSLLEKNLLGRENIVFDVAGLKHVDSAFLRFLVKLKAHVAKDSSTTIELVGVTPRLRRILETAGLSRAFLSTSTTKA